MKVKSLCSAVINCVINWSLGIELLRHFSKAMSTKASLAMYRIHTHMCIPPKHWADLERPPEQFWGVQEKGLAVPEIAARYLQI